MTTADGKAWCDRHWAPIPREHTGPDPINGLLATIRLTQQFLYAMTERAEVPGTPEHLDMQRLPPHVAMNRAMRRHEPLCCWFGDAAVHELLERCRRSRLKEEQRIREGEHHAE